MANEAKHCRFHKPPRRKDRESGRSDKRSARQEDRKEILDEQQRECYDE